MFTVMSSVILQNALSTSGAKENVLLVLKFGIKIKLTVMKTAGLQNRRSQERFLPFTDSF